MGLARPELGRAAASPPLSGARGSRFAELLAAAGSSLDRGERLVAVAAAGGAATTDAASLISLQLGIYRYAETVELAAKMVEGGSAAVRTTMQSG